jgi:hypothetical protein
MTRRKILLMQPTAVELPTDAATVAAYKANTMAQLAEAVTVDANGGVSRMADVVCWDLVGRREVVVEGGLQQVCVCVLKGCVCVDVCSDLERRCMHGKRHNRHVLQGTPCSLHARRSWLRIRVVGRQRGLLLCVYK